MVSIVIPIYNAGLYLPALLKALESQIIDHELILIDSGSKDKTLEILKDSKAKVIQIKKEDFNHGKTRNLGIELSAYEIVVFLTQDALPVSNQTIQILVSSLEGSGTIAMAYGRQLPYENAGPFGAFARVTNYPEKSLIKGKELIPRMGIRTCSCSNSFAAYKKSELLKIGGFPENTILGEDVSVAAKFILDNKTVAYCAESMVFHSHDYTILEEFKRYFDIGVFHYDQRENMKFFKRAENEGLKYIAGEYKYLMDKNLVFLLPELFARSFLKYTGYRMGLAHKLLPSWLKKKVSMHCAYWQ